MCFMSRETFKCHFLPLAKIVNSMLSEKIMRSSKSHHSLHTLSYISNGKKTSHIFWKIRLSNFWKISNTLLVFLKKLSNENKQHYFEKSKTSPLFSPVAYKTYLGISLTFFVEVEVIKGRTRYFRHLTSGCGLNTGPSIKNGRTELYKIKCW